MTVKKIVLERMPRLPAFCHATIAGDFVYVSGTLGIAPGESKLAAGGTGPETLQTLRNIEAILAECGCVWHDVVKANVFLSDMSTFAAMNEAYTSIVGDDPPARITVGRAELAMGAAVEIDCVAYKPAG